MELLNIVLLVVLAQVAICSPQGPLIAWGYNNNLPAIDSSSLSEGISIEKVLSPLSRQSKVLVFYQPGLTVEDFTLHSNEQLKKLVGNNFLWFPTIKNPSHLKTSKHVDTNMENIHEDLNNNELALFELPKRSTNENLDDYRAHIVNLMTEAVSKIGDMRVTAVLTGNSEMVTECNEDILKTISNRHTMAAAGDAGSKSVEGKIFNITGGLLLFTAGVNVTIMNDGKLISKDTLKLNESTGDGDADTQSANITLKFVEDIEFRMKFKIGKMQWEMNDFTATIKIDKKPMELTFAPNVTVPKGYSFTCSSAVFNRNKDPKRKDKVTMQVTFFQIQIQAGNLFSGKFSAPYDCLGVLSIPLWMGLIITLIFTIILIMGSCVVMNIKTMDKFDDPKGKTITVPTTE